MGSNSKAAGAARNVGKILFPLLGRVIHQHRSEILSPCPEEQGCCGAGCQGLICVPGVGKQREPSTSPGHPSQLLSALPWVFWAKNPKIFKEANGSVDTVMSKSKSFGERLCKCCVCDVLSSEHLLFSICIDLPKVTALAS